MDHRSGRSREVDGLRRLFAELAQLTRRFAGRSGPGPDLDEAVRETLREADALDRSAFAGVCVDTTALSVDEVAVRIREACSRWPGFGAPAARSDAAAVIRAPASRGPANPVPAEPDDWPPASATDGHVPLICGPAGVGKSAIGFQAYLRVLSAGMMAAYVDLDQIGFVSPAPAGDPGRHQLKAGNLAAMWRNYRAGGGSWPQPGDPLRGRPAADLTGHRRYRGPRIGGARSGGPARHADRHRRAQHRCGCRRGQRGDQMAPELTDNALSLAPPGG